MINYDCWLLLNEPSEECRDAASSAYTPSTTSDYSAPCDRWLFVPCEFRRGTESVSRFNERISVEQYEVIYDGATIAFKTAIGCDTFRALCGRIARTMGACREAALTYNGFQTVPQASFINLTYKRKCDNGTLDEQFVWQMIGGMAVLIGFHANNPLLLTD